MRLRFVAAAVVLAAGVGPVVSSPAVADEPQETVVPATIRDTNISAYLWSSSTYSGIDAAGAQGVVHSLEDSGLVWTRYADGVSMPVARSTGLTYAGTGSDAVAYRYADGRIELRDAADGTTRTLQMPAELTYLVAYGDLAVGYRKVTRDDGTTLREMHLLFPQAEGGTRDVTVTGVPEGVNLGRPVGGDSRSLLFLSEQGGQLVAALVDRRTGVFQDLSAAAAKVYRGALMTDRHVVLFNFDDPTVMVYDRADLSAAPAAVTLTGSGPSLTQDFAVVGDWLVYRPVAGTAVLAKPLAGGPAVTLLRDSQPKISQVSDGTAVVIGRTAAANDDYGVQRLTPGADGAPVITQVKALPKPPRKIQGISLDQGRLVVVDNNGGITSRISRLRTVATTGTPIFGDVSRLIADNRFIGDCAAADVGCSQLHGTADGRIAWVERAAGDYDRIRAKGAGAYDLWERGVPRGGRITDLSGDYLIYETATQQIVYHLDDAAVAPVTRTPRAAALSGDTLWSAEGTPGKVTAYDLTARKTTGSITTDAGCTPEELQALGRWLYWTCDGRAGVYDTSVRKSVPVPAGEAKLGDGYVVTHDTEAGKLRLTTVVGGVPASRVIGDLPDTGLSQRDVRWTVDESGANAAWVDAEQRVHLVPSGVPQQPLRLLQPTRNATILDSRRTDPAYYALTEALLSKPAASWQLTVRDAVTGKVVDVQDGGPVRGELKAGWDGLGPDGLLPTGRYAWTVSVVPADGVGSPLELRGTVLLENGAPRLHDHIGPGGGQDGIGDLLTLNSSGGLTFQEGTGAGTFGWKVTAGGWSTSTVAVPFGDLNGDFCNDVLVRMPDGSLRGYKVPCGKAPAPTMPYVKIGTGYGQYNVLTSPGDLTGDGRPDLLARKSSTGDLYLFAAKSGGTLAWPQRIRPSWSAYTHVVGAGDLNSDGHGDVLARDKAGTLWRYDGLGNGLLKDRVQVFTKWGTGYNAIVGVGDITADGRDDLVERDGAGNLFLNAGNGRGSFGARILIGTGWQGYRGLF
ncbi:FG-GAP repeat domain-containing protein [Streptomyces griseosporeus]